jgi:hypothetical protein
MYATQIGQFGSADFRSRTDAGPDYLPQLKYWGTFEFFCTRFLEPVYQDKGGYFVFKVK